MGFGCYCRYCSQALHCHAELQATLLQSKLLHRKHSGRNWVALSLAEAETLRRIIHLRHSQPVLRNSHVELALRFSPSAMPATLGPQCGIVLDATAGWRTGCSPNTGCTNYEANLVNSCFRFFNGEMFYPDYATNLIVRALSNVKRSDREAFFLSTIASRRRVDRKWDATPLAKVFVVPDEWIAFKQQAQALFVDEAIRNNGLTLWEAFTTFDSDVSVLLLLLLMF